MSLHGGVFGGATRPEPRPAPTGALVATILVLLVIPTLVLGGFVLYARSEYPGASKPAPPGKPGLLVWGDDVLSSKLQMRFWLSEHGGSYRRWKQRHPAAVRLVAATEVRRARVDATKRKKAAAAAKRRTR